MLNTKTGYTTPWHCSVALLADGEWVSAPMGDFEKDPRLEVVYEDGRPSYFKEKPREANEPSISETTASYLQAPTRINGNHSGYSSPDGASRVSGYSTPNRHPSSPVSGVESALGSPASSYTNGDASTPYGRRLIPQIMDDLAFTEPERTVFSVANFFDNSHAFQHISARTFTKAVDKTAWWLQNQVGKPTSIQPVGYIGPRKSERSPQAEDSCSIPCTDSIKMIFDTFS